MSRLVVSEFVTVDGIFEDPGGGEAFDLGGWAFRFDRGPSTEPAGETLILTDRPGRVA